MSVNFSLEKKAFYSFYLNRFKRNCPCFFPIALKLNNKPIKYRYILQESLPKPQQIFSLPSPNESRRKNKPAQVLQEVKMCQSESKTTPAVCSTLNSAPPKAVLKEMLLTFLFLYLVPVCEYFSISLQSTRSY